MKDISNSVSIKKFIRNYLKEETEEYKDITSHAKLKEKNHEFVKRTTFYAVKANPGLVCNGSILLVRDNEQIIPYVNPNLLTRGKDITKIVEILNKLNERIDDLSDPNVIRDLKLERSILQMILKDLSVIEIYSEDMEEKNDKHKRKRKSKRN